MANQKKSAQTHTAKLPAICTHTQPNREPPSRSLQRLFCLELFKTFRTKLLVCIKVCVGRARRSAHRPCQPFGKRLRLLSAFIE